MDNKKDRVSDFFETVLQILKYVGCAALILATLSYCNKQNEERREAARDESYQEGYEEGYNFGYSDGHDDGYDTGKEDGYSDGYQDGETDGSGWGYDEGYRDGLADGVKAEKNGIDVEGYDINWREVDSSALSKIGYDSENRVVAVEFHDSGVYFYLDVPDDVWEGFRDAESKGSYYNDSIKGKYESQKVG